MLTYFSCLKQDYPAFKKQHLTLAQQSSTMCPYNHGLLGYLLLVFPALHIPAPFEPVLPPGEEPDLAGDVNASAASRHNVEWSKWKFYYVKFQSQQKELNSIKMIFLKSFDSTT